MKPFTDFQGSLLPLFLVSGLFSGIGCSKSEDFRDRSEEFPPGVELAGSYRLLPGYHEETLLIGQDGEVEYLVAKEQSHTARKGLAYRNRFRLVIFLDGEPEPTGIFMLNDRLPERWPGSWRGEIRFMRFLGP